jgi:molybdopterin converting factor small subunit
MAKVKVKYLGVIEIMVGKRNEEIIAESFKELVNKIGNKYKKLGEYLKMYDEKITDPPIVILYNSSFIRSIENYEGKIKDGDEVVLMGIIGGG